MMPLRSQTATTSTTESYTRVNLDDMNQTMNAFSEYQNSLRKKAGCKINDRNKHSQTVYHHRQSGGGDHFHLARCSNGTN